jgi:DNA-binding transcriptional MerR regulator
MHSGVTTYSLADTARILHISSARLRYWERTELVTRSAVADGQPAFGFRDLVCIRTILALLEDGIPLRRIRRSVDRIRERIPELDRPLGGLRVWLEGSSRVVVRHQGALLEPDGQLVLDFDLAPPSEDDVAPLPLPTPRAVAGEADFATALEWFERGCQLDSSSETLEEAIHAYTHALRSDPGFADAHCNLGTVHYNRGERDRARACYEDALRHESEHVEANFNLGNLLEESGQREAALGRYKVATRADPLFPDAQLNLALLYEKFDLRSKAKEHWRRYLQLVPKGGWADIARQHLAE